MRTRTTSDRRPSSGALIALGFGALMAAWLEFFVIRHQAIFGVLATVIAAALAVVAVHHHRQGGWASLAGLSVVVAVLQLLWITTTLYPFWIAAFVATVFLALSAWFCGWTARAKEPVQGAARLRRRAAHLGGVLGASIAGILSIALVSIAIDPSLIAVAVQSASGSGNSFEPRAAPTISEVNGAQLTNDVEYGSTYPNSYLDIYIADNDPSISRPTYLVVHGGGFIAGSKSDGDPNAAGADDAYFALGSGPVLDAGYNVVAIDYALAPQVRYPVPVIQLGEAMQFLEANGAQYGLDMSRVVLAGGSAGGHIVAQYAAIQTSADYAQQLGIEQTMDATALEAVVLDSAALAPARAGRSQAPVLSRDWLFDLSLRSYVGTSKELLAQADITKHVSAGYPPTFIADGNTGTFPDQAIDLATTLTALGVENDLNIPPVSEVTLAHGYMAASSPWTDMYNEHKLAFLAAVVR